MRALSLFFHRLFNPHCPHCILEERCNSCEVLKSQLDILRNENSDLIKALIDLTKPVQPIINIPEETSQEPIRINRQGWRHRAAIMENASKARATSLREAAKNKTTVPIEELEKAVGIKLTNDTEGEEDAKVSGTN